MMIVLDTNVVSELFRQKPDIHVEKWLAMQDGLKVYFASVGEAELRHGLALLPKGKKRENLTKAIEDILEQDFCGRILSFDRLAARSYADVAAERRMVGNPISQFDCQIAAIVRIHGASIATRNTDDFKGCGITVINPWKDGKHV